MPDKYEHTFSSGQFKTELADHGHDLGELPGWMFLGLLLYADYQDSYISNGSVPVTQAVESGESKLRMKQALTTAKFAGAEFTTDLSAEGITHVLIGNDKSRAKTLRELISKYVLLESCSQTLSLTKSTDGNASPGW